MFNARLFLSIYPGSPTRYVVYAYHYKIRADGIFESVTTVTNTSAFTLLILKFNERNISLSVIVLNFGIFFPVSEEFL